MTDWANFYIVVGSSAAALIGMQFVVMTLIAARPRHPTEEAFAAFATPTVVHLAVAIVASAVMSAPWRSPSGAALALALCGVAGMVYGAVVLRRVYRQTFYDAVWQDWVWYAVLPCVSYATLAVGALAQTEQRSFGPGLIAGAALALLLIGIHNAWDTVVHVVILTPDELRMNSDGSQ
jgi:hypothetical protein